jgi:hypothetical protein
MKTKAPATRNPRTRRAAEKAPPPVPNGETIAAMKAARRGQLVKAGKPDKLLASLKL